jgi:hypothetical protein
MSNSQRLRLRSFKRALRDSTNYLQVVCDHFAFKEDCDTRKFVARIWEQSK